MSKYDREEKMIGRMMKQSFVEMPFADFEDRLMKQIVEEGEQKKTAKNPLRIAWLFFALGLFLGLVITSITTNFDHVYWGIPAKNISYAIQFVVAVVLLLQFDKLLDYTLRKKT